MRSFIESNSQKHQKPSMRTLQDRFIKEPYGFVEDDVEWLCAKLFKDGDINVYISNAQITTQDKTENELVNYFTKKQYADSLTTEIRQKANDAQLKTMREIMKDLFNDSAPDDDEDTLHKKFKHLGQDLLRQLEDFSHKYRECPEYPGEAIIKSGIDILQNILPISSSYSFFSELSQKKDDILDFSEDYENIKTFFSGSQSGIFAGAVKAVKSFERNKNFISGSGIPDLVTDINAITDMPNPYKDIFRLPDLTDTYTKALAEQCQKDREPLLSSLEEKKKSVFAKLEGKSYGDDLNAALIKRFDAMERKIKECDEPSLLKSMNYELDRIYTDALNEIEAVKIDAFNAISKQPLHFQDQVKIKEEFKINITTHISIKSLNISAWHIETTDDLEKYITDLRHKISAELRDDTIISVEF
jgi:hypothetical protein